MTHLISGIVATLIGIAVIALACYGSKKNSSKNSRCTAVTEGTVIAFEQKEYVENDHSDNPSTYIEKYYYPIYEYFVNGERYEVQSSFGKKTEDVSMLGQKKPILYNPENCSECYISGESYKKVFKIFNVVGIIILIAGLVNFLLYFLMK